MSPKLGTAAAVMATEALFVNIHEDRFDNEGNKILR